MSELLTQIENHQRVLITGPRKSQILEACKTVLNFYAKPYSWIDEEGTLQGSEESLVFIVAGGEADDYLPHIALIDSIKEKEQDSYLRLANSIPKSGTLVYNLDDEIAEAICAVERPDVHQETYSGNEIEAAKGLLRRLGVTEDRFDAVYT